MPIKNIGRLWWKGESVLSIEAVHRKARSFDAMERKRLAMTGCHKEQHTTVPASRIKEVILEAGEAEVMGVSGRAPSLFQVRRSQVQLDSEAAKRRLDTRERVRIRS